MHELLNRVHHGDCLETMRSMPSESVCLVVTSPPYNLRNTTGGGIRWRKNRKYNQNPNNPSGRHPLAEGYAEHDDNMPHDQYVKWQRQCMTEMMRVLRPDGAIFYNHKWRVQSGLLQDRADIMQGFPVRQIIIWDQGKGINKNAGYFLPAYEVIYLIAKPYFKLVDRANEYGNIWKMGRENNNPHPAPFPVKLAQRCISSTPAEIVLDPFMGSGTTAVAAIRANRDWIGIEKSEEYVRMAEERIGQELRQGKLI